MIKNQVKNTIYRSIWVILAVLFGEGILGVSLYWPFLVLLLDWGGVFWVAFGVGVLVAVLNGLTIGLASLVIVLAVGIMMLILGEGQMSLGIQLGLMLLLAVVTNKVLGIHESLGEVVLLVVVSMLVFRAGTPRDTIRIKYR